MTRNKTEKASKPDSRGGRWKVGQDVRDIITAQPDRLEEIIMKELSSNPFLELYDEESGLTPADERFDRGNIVERNEDFDLPLDEEETGELEPESPYVPWEFAAPARFMRSTKDLSKYGKASDLQDPQKKTQSVSEPSSMELSRKIEPLDELIIYFPTPSDRPTYTVKVVHGSVVATVLPTSADWLQSLPEKFVESEQDQHMHKRASEFIARLEDRRKFLEALARLLLEDIQADFFRQPTLDLALKRLVPLTPLEENAFPSFSRLGDHKASWSNAGKLLVESDLGVYKLATFWPEVAALRRLWVHFAQKNGKKDVKSQFCWMHTELKAIASTFDDNDPRLSRLSPLLETTEKDCRNAHEALKKFLMDQQ